MSSLLRSTGIVALSTLLSRILGFARDMIFAAVFGVSNATDAFWVAFRIPNLFRRLVAEGSLTISFIPVYQEYLVNSGENEARELARKTLSILAIITGGIVISGMVFSNEIVSVFAAGFEDEAAFGLAVELTRFMFPYLISASFVAFSMGVLNSHGFFFAPAFSPVLLNVGIICGIVFTRHYFDAPLFGAALGVLTGGLLQMLIQVPYLIRSGFRFRFSADFSHPGVRKIFRLIAPALFGTAVYQINILMGTILASMLEPGSISYLYYSDRLTEMVLGVFIISIGNVILPEMSRISAEGDIARLKNVYADAVSAALFVAVPAAAALIIIGKPILSVLFLRGEFTYTDLEMTYKALFFASTGILSVSVLRITTPVFYSLKDTGTPVLTAFAAFIINISLAYVLMGTSLRHGGIALANAIAVTVQMLLLLAVLKKKIGGIAGARILSGLMKNIFSALFMGGVLYYLAGLADWENGRILRRALVLCLMVCSGGFVYFAASALSGTAEVRYIFNKIKKRVMPGA